MRAAAEQAKAMAAGGAQPQAAEAARVAALQAVGTAAQAAGIAEKPAGPAAAPASAPPPAPPRSAQPLGAIQLISGASAGKELELTRERVRQLEAQALAKLTDTLGELEPAEDEDDDELSLAA